MEEKGENEMERGKRCPPELLLPPGEVGTQTEFHGEQRRATLGLRPGVRCLLRGRCKKVPLGLMRKQQPRSLEEVSAH